MSDIALMLPLNQLLRSEPAITVAIPIQRSVMVPWMKFPTTVLLVSILIMVVWGGYSILSGILEIPFISETKIINMPANVEKILIKPVGVGLPREPIDLSISNARTMKAIPSILNTKAKASLVNPKTVDKPKTTNSAPGTPKKNFE